MGGVYVKGGARGVGGGFVTRACSSVVLLVFGIHSRAGLIFDRSLDDSLCHVVFFSNCRNKTLNV